jgi:hypothetical protein
MGELLVHHIIAGSEIYSQQYLIDEDGSQNYGSLSVYAF